MEGRNGGTLIPFDKGESGNPNGRPKGKWLTALLQKHLESDGMMYLQNVEVVDENQKPTGERVSVRVNTGNAETLIIALMKQAKKGNMKAIKEAFDRIEGQAKLPIDLNPNKDVDDYSNLTNDELQAIINSAGEGGT